MLKIFVFVVGAAIVAISLPQVLAHHARAELMQLAWCSSSGQGAPANSLFQMHCIACPTFLIGAAAMVLAPMTELFQRFRFMRTQS
ncbi:hypothetical protein WNY37_11580 [Henriciella sp. AS95]|uniref:hypothetical protein n=1 Tax=Henriciella sp. AS95 TaxID=3135782 RepID=UPI003182966C